MMFVPINVTTGTITTKWGGHYDSAQEVRSGAIQPGLMLPLATGGGTVGQGYPAVLSPTLTAHNLDSRSPQSEEQQRIGGAVHDASLAVRRLTPLECERLMGWSDNWTRYGRNLDGSTSEIADTHRYRMCGNGVVAPVASWIANRITEQETNL